MSREAGNIGEDEAVIVLQNAGYQILERNFFARVGEIDVVALDGKTVCFVEVKKRAYDSFGGGAAAISKTKIQKILKSAKRYLYNNNLLDRDYRLDAVIISGSTEPEIIKNIYTEGMS